MLDENTKNLPSENLGVNEDKTEKSNAEKETQKKEIAEEVNSEIKGEVKEQEPESEDPEKASTDEKAVAEEKAGEEEKTQVDVKADQAAKPAEDLKKAEEEVQPVEDVKPEEESKPDDEQKTEGEAKDAEGEKKDGHPAVKKEVKESVKIAIPAIQFAKLSLDDLVKVLEEFLHDYEIRDIRNQIEEIKSSFTKKFSALVKEKRAEHESQEGEKSEFFYDSPVKARFDSLIREYKRKRRQYYKDIEQEQKQNLELKLSLIEELKDLIDTAEPETMYKSFKDLQERWRAVGQIPRANYNDVWRTYHHHVERFYDLLHLNNDFRDLDFKHNLEEKTKLVETA